MEENNQKGFIDKLKPREAFKAGFISAFAIVFVIGFFVLLGMMLGDKDFSFGSKKSTNNNFAAKQAPVVAQDTGIQFVPPHDEDYVRGNPDAKITLVEYSDIDCPYCQKFHETAKQIVEAYPNDVNWVYRHFPLPQLHPDAPKKAEAAECVGELGGNDAYWSFLDKVIAEKTPLASLSGVASSLGVNSASFQECLDSGKYADKISGTTNEALAAGGRGTPYSILYDGQNTVPINGALPFEQVKVQIDSLLQ